MRRPHLHTIILVTSLLLLAFLFFIDIDSIGERMYGPKWHIRSLDENYRKNYGLYSLFQSLHFSARMNFRQAFGFHLLGPPVFLFLCWQVPYRMWLMIRGPRRIPYRLRRAHALIGVVLLALVLVSLWMQGGNV